ncbi:MAG: hypothetical protein ABW321_13875 [Polyangiales bacterium]
MPKPRRARRRKQQQEGAVLVEAVIVASSMVLLCAALLFIHTYASRQIRILDEAREEVWRRAMNECNTPEPLFQDLARDLMRFDLPIPDNIVPLPLETQKTFRIPWLFGNGTIGGAKELKFVCNPRPSQGDPLARPNEWVIGLFL